jgi:C1A family cysteine protease
MKKLTFAALCVLLPSLVLASEASSFGTKEKLILKTIWKDLGYQKELTFQDHDSSPTPKQETKDEHAHLTPGQRKILELKKKNRLKIKNLHSKKKSFEKLSLKEQWQQKQSSLRADTLSKRSQERARIDKIKNQWKQKREQFFKELDGYKDAQFKFEKPLKPIPKHLLKKSVVKKKITKLPFSLVKSSLTLPIRDQKARPTCAAFAAVRAIELRLLGQGQNRNLSEQYFYWSSKPKCRQRPCARKGSWVTHGLKYSMGQSGPNIPAESSCPYSPVDSSSNQTQIPLQTDCSHGLVGVKNFARVDTLSQATSYLDKNLPLIIALELSPNFYSTKGLVGLSNMKSSASTDSHAKGHALVLVGYMNLPKKLHATEGSVCFLTANSWGEGWGVGGHACLSENWIKRHRIANAMIAIDQLKY